MKKLIFIFLFVVLSIRGYAQSSWGVELGTTNSLSYTKQFSKRWGVDARLGLQVDDVFSLHKGFSPLTEVLLKRTFSRESRSSLYQSGGYWGVNGYVYTPRLFGTHWVKNEKYPLLFDELHPVLNIGFEPTFGWVFSLGERSYVRTSLGLNFGWEKFSYPDGDVRWRTPSSRSNILLHFSAVYSFRF